MIVHVDVRGDGKGALDVSWEQAGDGPVEVAVGPTPDQVDHGHPVAFVDGSSVSLRDLGPGRHYVSVAPAGGGSAVVAAERLVPLEGTFNFRDLGGYRTDGGGRTRWGLVFRSDALHRLTTEDLAVIGRIGLRVVYDLRRDAERERAPSALPDDIRRELVSIGGEAGETKEILDRILDGEFEAIDDEFLVDAYVRMADSAATTFGRVLTGLTDPDGLPALFHCSAGKDRTGMTAALLLSVLGVDESTVLDDYELSAAYYTEQQMDRVRPTFEEAGIDLERFRGLFGAPRRAMSTLLDTLHARHGTIERFLVDVAGVAPEVIDDLRARLVQPA